MTKNAINRDDDFQERLCFEYQSDCKLLKKILCGEEELSSSLFFQIFLLLASHHHHHSCTSS